MFREELCMPLLSLSPNSKRDSEGEVKISYAITIDADLNVRQLQHVFNYFHVDVHALAICQIVELPTQRVPKHMDKPTSAAATISWNSKSTVWFLHRLISALSIIFTLSFASSRAVSRPVHFYSD